MDQFNYYMIRVKRPAADPAPGGRHEAADQQLEPLAGVVERLATGEKRSFADCDELVRLLNGWSEGPPNMQADAGAGKA